MNPPTERDISRNIQEVVQQQTPPSNPLNIFFHGEWTLYSKNRCVGNTSNFGTTSPHVLPTENFPFWGALAYHVSGFPLHDDVDWMPPIEAVVVGNLPLLLLLMLLSPSYQKRLFHGPCVKSRCQPPVRHFFVAASMVVVIIFDQYQSQWPLPSTLPPPPPLTSRRYGRGGWSLFKMENDTRPDFLKSRSPRISVHMTPIDWW